MAAIGCGLVFGGPAFPQPATATAPLDLTVSARGLAAGRPATAVPSPRRGLAEAIALAAPPGLLQAGFDAAKQAIVDCQRGDYPGGGLGLLSLPFGTAHARTDHCFR